MQQIHNVFFKDFGRACSAFFALLLFSSVAAQGVGTPAPDFALVDRAGETVSLSDFQGKPLVLNAWATWCAPCVEELPFFQRLDDEVNGEGTKLGFLLLNSGEAPDAAAAFLEELAVTLPAAFDATRDQAEALEVDKTLDVLRDYRVRGMPTTFFIDAEGVIQGVKVGLLLPNEASTFLENIGVSWQP